MNEMQADDRKCQATTKSGKPCGARPLQGQDLCALHADPGRAQELAKRPRKNGVNLKPEANPPEIPPLQTASQIRDFLAQVMADVRRKVLDQRTASTLATLATSQLKAISAAELEQRVTDLEKKIGESAATDAPTQLLPSEEEWQRLFATDEYDAPPAPQPAQDGAPHREQPSGKARTMPEDWTVPERPAQIVEDDESVPLGRWDAPYE